MPAQPEIFRSRSLSGGLNTRFSPANIADNEASELVNADITVDGIREKRKEPVLACTLGSETAGVLGLANFALRDGTPYIPAICNGSVYVWDGSGSTVASALANNTGKTLSATVGTANYMFEQAGDSGGDPCLYFTDGVNTGGVFRYDPSQADAAKLGWVDLSATIGTQVVKCMKYAAARMWYGTSEIQGKTSNVYFSSVNDPETVPATNALNVAYGAGDAVVRLETQGGPTGGKLVAFKGGVNGKGSIHIIDISTASDSTAATMYIHTIADNIEIPSGRLIARYSSTNERGDILFATKQGIRSIAQTQQDAGKTPTLPFSLQIPDYLADLIPSSIKDGFLINHDDEIHWFCREVGDTTTSNNLDLCYSLKSPKQNEYQGWQPIQMNGGTGVGMECLCGVVASFTGTASGAPCLYLGNYTGGRIIRAFAQNGSAYKYREVAKKFELDGHTDFTCDDISILFDKGASGTYDVWLQDDNDKTYLVDTLEIARGGAKLSGSGSAFPLDLSDVGTSRLGLDCRGLNAGPFRDVRVIIQSRTGGAVPTIPKIRGWELRVDRLNFRRRDREQAETTDRSSAAFALVDCGSDAWTL